VKLFFDLDGTLMDPGVGITRCLQHALAGLGRPVPSAESLRRFVGPPLRDTFAELLESQEKSQLDQAVALYRARFVPTGMFENEVYTGIPEGLERLRRAGHRLWVVTSKPHVYAKRILGHFNLGGWFEAVYGSELSGVNADKADLIRHVLRIERIEAEEPWMVGDRVHDVEAARKTGIAAIGVLWGYGTEEEMSNARPHHLVRSMAELCDLVAAR
jgi:phosphoglycolate phosphatase